MKLATLFVAALILGGCAATGTARIGAGPDLSSFQGAKQEPRPKLLGEVGETPGHFYARMLSRFCASDESESTVRQVLDVLDDCRERSARCDREACAAVAWGADRCSEELELRRASAVSNLRAELDAIIARTHP